MQKRDDTIYVLEQELRDTRTYRNLLLIIASCAVGWIAMDEWSDYEARAAKRAPVVFTRALRFEDYFICPVNAEQYRDFTNRYPANVVDYPLIFK